MTVQWLTTANNPHRRDDGIGTYQTGWKLHAVEASESDKLSELGRKPALCGLRPRHGWTLDLFVEDKCKRCEAALEKIK